MVGDGIIFILDTSVTEVTVDEVWHITKADLSVRGPGWDFILKPTAATEETIHIEAEGVSIENIKVDMTLCSDLSNGLQWGIKVDQPNCTIKRIKVARGIDGGIIISANNTLVYKSIIEHHTGNAGVRIEGTAHECLVRGSYIYDCLYGIVLADSVEENSIEGNTIHDMSTGVMIEDATVSHVYITADNTFANLGRRLNNDIGATGVHDIKQEDLDDIWGYVIDNNLSAAEIKKLMASVLLGKVSGADTSQVKFRDLADTKDRVTADVDGKGNRTAVTLDET